MKNEPLIYLYSSLTVFILLLLFFAIQSYSNYSFFPIAAVLGLVFLYLGVRLIMLARKEKKKLKPYMMTTGISAVAPLPLSLLHNIFYGLSVTFESYLFEILSVSSFIIALVIAPVIFTIGITGSIILYKKKLKSLSLK